MHSILIAGVDLGTTKTCAVIAEVHEDPYLRRELKILGVGQAKSTGMRQVVTHIEETTDSVKAALEEAELMAGVNVDRVYVGISGEHIRAMTSPGVVAVTDDEVSRFDLQRVHERVLAPVLALLPEETDHLILAAGSRLARAVEVLEASPELLDRVLDGARA